MLNRCVCCSVILKDLALINISKHFFVVCLIEFELINISGSEKILAHKMLPLNGVRNPNIFSPGAEEPGKAQKQCNFHIVYLVWARDSPPSTPVLNRMSTLHYFLRCCVCQ